MANTTTTTTKNCVHPAHAWTHICIYTQFKQQYECNESDFEWSETVQRIEQIEHSCSGKLYTTIAAAQCYSTNNGPNNCRCFSLSLRDSISVQRHNINTKNDKFIARRHGIHSSFENVWKSFKRRSFVWPNSSCYHSCAAIVVVVVVFIFICTKAHILWNSIYTITSMPTCSVFPYMQ